MRFIRAVRLAVAAIGLATLTAWLSSELVYQVRLTLDDDAGLMPFDSGDEAGAPRDGRLRT